MRFTPTAGVKCSKTASADSAGFPLHTRARWDAIMLPMQLHARNRQIGGVIDLMIQLREFQMHTSYHFSKESRVSGHFIFGKRTQNGLNHFRLRECICSKAPFLF